MLIKPRSSISSKSKCSQNCEILPALFQRRISAFRGDNVRYTTNETFSNVGGLSLLKDWLQKRVVAFTDQARAFGLPPPKGILMLGVQGCFIRRNDSHS
jgi:SpoVK/Ycf46/Vps4 family AAA+-type ATPase